jgi:hypothetical protein
VKAIFQPLVLIVGVTLASPHLALAADDADTSSSGSGGAGGGDTAHEEGARTAHRKSGRGSSSSRRLARKWMALRQLWQSVYERQAEVEQWAQQVGQNEETVRTQAAAAEARLQQAVTEQATATTAAAEVDRRRKALDKRDREVTKRERWLGSKTRKVLRLLGASAFLGATYLWHAGFDWSSWKLGTIGPNETINLREPLTIRTPSWLKWKGIGEAAPLRGEIQELRRANRDLEEQRDRAVGEAQSARNQLRQREMRKGATKSSVAPQHNAAGTGKAQQTSIRTARPAH